MEALLQKLLAEGYNLHAVCLWAPLVATRQRGEPRSVREGKVWSAKDYPASTAGTLAMARRFSQQILLNEQQQQQGAQHESSTVANPSMPVATAQATTSAAASNGGAPSSSSSTNAGTSAQWVSLSMWDNSIFPAKPCSLDEFAHLSDLDEAASVKHLERATKKVRTTSMAGVEELHVDEVKLRRASEQAIADAEGTGLPSHSERGAVLRHRLQGLAFGLPIGALIGAAIAVVIALLLRDCG